MVRLRSWQPRPGSRTSRRLNGSAGGSVVKRAEETGPAGRMRPPAVRCLIVDVKAEYTRLCVTVEFDRVPLWERLKTCRDVG